MRSKRDFTDFTMSMATRIGQEASEQAHRMVNDPDKAERQAANRCLRCWYESRMAGQAITEWACGLCGKESSHSNTGVPRLCEDCAAKHKLCGQCGADRELAQRKIWPVGSSARTQP